MIARIRWTFRWSRLTYPIAVTFEWAGWQVRLFVERKFADSRGMVRVYDMRRFDHDGMRPHYQKLYRRERRWHDRVWHPLALRFDVIGGSGRYEGEDSPAKTAWFDDHSEYQAECAGTTEGGLYVERHSYRPPWARKDEFWTIGVDSLGFRNARQYATEEDAHAQIAMVEAEQQYGDEDEPGSLMGGFESDEEEPSPTYGPSFFTADEIRRANTLDREEM